jgi:hypothetical protein
MNWIMTSYGTIAIRLGMVLLMVQPQIWGHCGRYTPSVQGCKTSDMQCYYDLSRRPIDVPFFGYLVVPRAISSASLAPRNPRTLNRNGSAQRHPHRRDRAQGHCP